MNDQHPPWRVLASRTVISDAWLTVRAETCETAAGTRLDPFYVIETADAVAMVAVTFDQNLVLVRQYRHGYGGVTLELPAGAVDPGEQPVAAAMRELAEETGHVGRSARVLRAFSSNTLRFSSRMHAVLIEGVSLTAIPKSDPAERIETVLWPLVRADELFAEPAFANAAFAGVLALGLSALKECCSSSCFTQSPRSCCRTRLSPP